MKDFPINERLMNHLSAFVFSRSKTPPNKSVYIEWRNGQLSVVKHKCKQVFAARRWVVLFPERGSCLRSSRKPLWEDWHSRRRTCRSQYHTGKPQWEAAGAANDSMLAGQERGMEEKKQRKEGRRHDVPRKRGLENCHHQQQVLGEGEF